MSQPMPHASSMVPPQMAEAAHKITHDGDIVRVSGRALRMEFMVLDAFWAHGRVIVLLDPTVYLDKVNYSSGRRKPRDPLKNLRAYSPGGELLWQAEQPLPEDHYYRIESREPLRALSFSAFRCDIDPESGRIADKQSLR